MRDLHQRFHLWESNLRLWAPLEILSRLWRFNVAQSGDAEGKGSQRPGSWEGAGEARWEAGGGWGASTHVLVGDRRTMEPLVIVQDPPPASQRVPSAGWIWVAAWGWGGGP